MLYLHILILCRSPVHKSDTCKHGFVVFTDSVNINELYPASFFPGRIRSSSSWTENWCVFMTPIRDKCSSNSCAIPRREVRFKARSMDYFMMGELYTQVSWNRGTHHGVPPFMEIPIHVPIATVHGMCLVFVGFWEVHDAKSPHL